ncbi:MAG: ankyrin repeat domain-containing protein [Sphingomonadales bacterium]
MKNFGKFSFVLLLPLLAIGFQGTTNAQFSDAYDFRVAIENNDLGEARSRIFGGANVNGRHDGLPYLMIALSNRYYDMARLLLDNGAYVNMDAIPNLETPLMLMATNGDETGLKMLLDFNPDLNATNKSGQTALMKAAQSRKTAVAKLLVEAGADVFQTDYVGRDALMYAKEARARNIIRLLEEAGVN